MAVDTRDKRSSCLGYGLKVLELFPDPDNSITEPDFEHIAGLYRGIQVDPPPSGGGVDTRDKRGSAIHFDKPYVPVYSNPDGSLSQADRQHTAHKYHGILAGGAPVGNEEIEQAKSIHRFIHSRIHGRVN